MKHILLLPLLLSLTACLEFQPNLETLGESSSYSDEEIPDDFTPPEEDIADGGEDSQTPTDEDPEPIQVVLKNTFYIEDQLFSLAHGSAKRWDGCRQEKESQGGYNSDTQCGRAFFHPSFAVNLNEVFYVCISDAAAAAGLPQPSKIFINHIGSYNDRPARGSTRLSNHAYARALDIKSFNLVDSSGSTYQVSTHINHYSGAQAKFYDEFRDCWRESMPSACTSSQIEYQGSIGHPSSKLGGNTLHNDHIHLAFPLCAGA